MINSPSILICAIPGQCWGNDSLSEPLHSLQVLLRDYKVSQRRIKKRVNLDQERIRYNELKAMIEATALNNSKCLQNDSIDKPSRSLQVLIREYKACKQRIKKHINLDQERIRYNEIKAMIEASVLYYSKFLQDVKNFNLIAQTGVFPAFCIGQSYFKLLHAVKLKAQKNQIDANIGNSRPYHQSDLIKLLTGIVSPVQINNQIKTLKLMSKTFGIENSPEISNQIHFLEKQIKPRGCGIIEVQIAMGDELFDPTVLQEIPSTPSFMSKIKSFFKKLFQSPKKLNKPETKIVKPQLEDWQHYNSKKENRGNFMVKRFTRQIEYAISTGQSVINVDSQRHEMTTKILSLYATKHYQKQPESQFCVLYSDGSEAKPFPLLSMQPYDDSWKPTREMHIALISMRHLELDQHVDFTWYRNVEVPSRGTAANADSYCYNATLEKFERLYELMKNERLRIYLYHTGFQPAIIGFYRALTRTITHNQIGIIDKSNWLQVVPMFAKKDNTTQKEYFDHGGSLHWPAMKCEIREKFQKHKNG